MAQLARLLRRYAFDPGPDHADEAAHHAQPERDEPRRVGFGADGDDRWRLSAVLALDEGALVEAALEAARRALDRDR